MKEATIRILVVGDSGVGKTSFVHYLCHKSPLDNATWTTGCNADVLLYNHMNNEHTEKVYIEFIDVGGHDRYEVSRSVYYWNIHGIICVYDLSNSRSYKHVKKWLSEIATAYKTGPDVFAPSIRSRNHDSFEAAPKLIIGNKMDKRSKKSQKLNPLNDLKLDSIEVSASLGQMDIRRINIFLERVIQLSCSSEIQNTSSQRNSRGIGRRNNTLASDLSIPYRKRNIV